MPPVNWQKPPIEVVQAFEKRRAGQRGPVGALVLWATWAVESLHYLDELDRKYDSDPHHSTGHDPQAIDIAHVRWATGTSITSLDLCAAALGREYCAWTGHNEPDLRDFDLTKDRNRAQRLRTMLPTTAIGWIDRVLSDTR